MSGVELDGWLIGDGRVSACREEEKVCSSSGDGPA
jgi:hypothetical protein